MGVKDITKSFCWLNDVFADIINGSLFGWAQIVSENEIANGKDKSPYRFHFISHFLMVEISTWKISH